jgi:4-diphosphocytidyl-2-C-methyl-D-erythritol kinase
MIVFPNAKINLGLNVISRQADGYHTLDTCFFPIPWKEALEVIPADKPSFSTSGIPLPGDEPNIVQKAHALLMKDFDIPPVSMHLHKAIPVGAGLGGGSADAGFALRLFNDLFELDLDEHALMGYAAALGADCAFFIKNQPMIAGGIGDKLQEIHLSMSGKSIMLVYPGIHIPTGQSYAQIVPQQWPLNVKTILLENPMEEWKYALKNDFEQSAFHHHPVLPDIKKTLYMNGAIYASMSGSGSCIYGIFSELPQIEWPDHYVCWSGVL